MSAYNERHVAKQRAEQVYLVASAADADIANRGRRCRSCRHFANVFRPRCQHGDFPVTKNASCALWVTA
jgi:hypothetical protein